LASTSDAKPVPDETTVCRFRHLLEEHDLARQLFDEVQRHLADKGLKGALVHAPRLIVCDEPTAALDADSGQTVLEILKDAALAPDRAVMVVTHDTRIYRFADRIAAMEDGRIHAVRTVPFAHLSEAA